MTLIRVRGRTYRLVKQNPAPKHSNALFAIAAVGVVGVGAAVLLSRRTSVSPSSRTPPPGGTGKSYPLQLAINGSTGPLTLIQGSSWATTVTVSVQGTAGHSYSVVLHGGASSMETGEQVTLLDGTFPAAGTESSQNTLVEYLGSAQAVITDTTTGQQGNTVNILFQQCMNSGNCASGQCCNTSSTSMYCYEQGKCFQANLCEPTGQGYC
jgi:hypothetical protein